MKRLVGLLGQAIKLFADALAPMHAAALAFYTIFSLAPLVIFAVAIAGLFVGRALATSEFLHLLQSILGTDSADFVQEIATSLARESISKTYTLITIGFLLISASVVFSQLKLSMDAIWGKTPTAGGNLVAGVLDTLRRRTMAVIMIFLAAGMLILSVILDIILASASRLLERWLPGISTLEPYLIWIITPVVAFITFAIIFRFLPEANPGWREVVAGAALSAVLFTVGASIVRIFLNRSGTISLFGAAGALIAILLWVYYSSWIVLFGVAFTRAYHEQRLALATPNATTPAAGS